MSLWTIDEILEMAELSRSGATDREISEKLGRSAAAVRARRFYQGGAPRQITKRDFRGREMVKATVWLPLDIVSEVGAEGPVAEVSDRISYLLEIGWTQHKQLMSAHRHAFAEMKRSEQDLLDTIANHKAEKPAQV